MTVAADAAFLRLPRSGKHHDLGLFGIGAGAAPRARGTVGLHHLAWQVDTVDELEQARLTDPDGNEFEVMWMPPREAWGDYEDSAPVDALDLAAEVRRWSGVGTAPAIPSPSPEAGA